MRATADRCQYLANNEFGSQGVAPDTDTDSPHLHELDNATPQTVAYRAQYVTKKGLATGPFCDPVVCTVSP